MSWLEWFGVACAACVGIAVAFLFCAGYFGWDVHISLLSGDGDDLMHDLSVPDEGLSHDDLAAFHAAKTVAVELQYGKASVFTARVLLDGTDRSFGAFFLFQSLGFKPEQLVPVFGMAGGSTKPIADWQQLGTLEMICSGGPNYGLHNDDAFIALGQLLGKELRVQNVLRMAGSPLGGGVQAMPVPFRDRPAHLTEVSVASPC